jgi:hypothetical protein
MSVYRLMLIVCASKCLWYEVLSTQEWVARVNVERLVTLRRMEIDELRMSEMQTSTHLGQSHPSTCEVEPSGHFPRTRQSNRFLIIMDHPVAGSSRYGRTPLLEFSLTSIIHHSRDENSGYHSSGQGIIMDQPVAGDSRYGRTSSHLSVWIFLTESLPPQHPCELH